MAQLRIANKQLKIQAFTSMQKKFLIKLWTDEHQIIFDLLPKRPQTFREMARIIFPFIAQRKEWNCEWQDKRKCFVLIFDQNIGPSFAIHVQVFQLEYRIIINQREIPIPSNFPLFHTSTLNTILSLITSFKPCLGLNFNNSPYYSRYVHEDLVRGGDMNVIGKIEYGEFGIKYVSMWLIY